MQFLVFVIIKCRQSSRYFAQFQTVTRWKKCGKIIFNQFKLSKKDPLRLRFISRLVYVSDFIVKNHNSNMVEAVAL